MSDFFRKGDWVIRIATGMDTGLAPCDSAAVGDLRQIDQDGDVYFPFVTHRNEDGRRDVIYTPHYRLATPEEVACYLGQKITPPNTDTETEQEPTGGLSGHYLADVPEPQRGGAGYTAECDDIIFALQMTFDEGEAFKSIWRTCTARLGYGKKGNTALYNAQKLLHRSKRILKRAEQGE